MHDGPAGLPDDEQSRETIRAQAATIARIEAEARRRDEVLREREAALALQTLAARQRLEERDAEIRRLQAEIRLYRESTSWRITAPLRAAVSLLRGIRPPPLRLPRLPRTQPGPAAPTGNDQAKAALRAGLAAWLRLFLSSGARLRLPSSLRPDVSILLVLHNQAELTFGCLSSLVECLGGIDVCVEVIVLDNGSTDATTELLLRTDGAAIIRSEENLHFLRGVNRAAKAASGRHLLLLNNDAQLLPGSLESALATLDSSGEIGAVGGRIVLPDGTLQEAGSIIWRDGTCSGYARGREPTDAEVLFRRDVDFCSGAFLLTPRDIFERLGGFDERYAPAYYEETDYCVRLWQAGYRVLYEPDAVVLHYEFGSATDSAEALERQRRNLSVFRDRHRAWLSEQLPRAPGNWRAARRVRHGAARVLVIEDRVPHRHLGSGYPRANDLVRSLAAQAEVTLFPMVRFSETSAAVRASLPAEVEVRTDKHFPDLLPFLKDRRGQFDAIIVCRPQNMKLFVDIGGCDAAVNGGAKIIYDAEAILTAREVLRKASLGAPLPLAEQARLLADEMALARRADVVLSVSPIEQRVFTEHGIAHVEVLGHALTPEPTTTTFEDRTDILFVGAVHEDWTPNADSLRWFGEEILPSLRRTLGKPIRLKIVGEVHVSSIAELDGAAFELLGAVDDLRPHYEAARLVVAPTRFAAGIPHKVGQAAAHGVPVVATDLLAQQLGWVPGRDLLAASDAAGFAAACALLYRNAAVWQEIRKSALQRVREDCAPERFDAVVSRLLDDVPKREAPARSRPPAPHAYGDWVRRYDTLTRADRAAILRRIDAMTTRPLISVLVPVYATPEAWLRRCIASVIDQLYPNWELVLVDDGSPQPHVPAILREQAARDRRILVIRRDSNGGIAAATQTALESATGDFVALLDHDDELADHALYMIAEALDESPSIDMIFSDEDKIDAHGTRFDPWFKSDWNPDLMLSQNVVVHLVAYRRSVLLDAGGFRAGYDGSQDYDAALRVAERTSPDRIRHLPFILYHWRAIDGSLALGTEQKTYPYDAAVRAISQHLARTGRNARVTREQHPGYYRVHWPLPPDPPRVTLIVPTRDRADLLRAAAESIFAVTEYSSYELLIVDNASTEAHALGYLADLAKRPNVRVLRYDAPFSFAALNNWAVQQTDSPLIAFLNNDVRVISPEWLGEMAGHAVRPDVGAVGAKLYYPDGTIQHAGIVVGIGGLAGHPHLGLPRGAPGYFGRAAVTQQFSAVTAACMVMRREVFLGVGGFDEQNFAVAFNDVDLCMRLRRAGYAIVWTPYAELYHHESASLGSAQSSQRQEQFDRESRTLRTLWAGAMLHDPFYNPNLTITGGDFSPAFPPRTTKPWHT
jgi:GT2 family glycosyltransferase